MKERYSLGVMIVIIIAAMGLIPGETAYPQEQAPQKTWKYIDEMSPQEIAEWQIDPRSEAEIPMRDAVGGIKIPAEEYPFSPPYTALEASYLAADLGILPKFKAKGFSILGVDHRINWRGNLFVVNLQNRTKFWYENHIEKAMMKSGAEAYRSRSVNTSPPDNHGFSILFNEYKTDKNFTKKQDRWIYLPALRRVRRITAPRRDDLFPNTDLSFDDASGRDPWEFEHRFLGVDILYHTARAPKHRYGKELKARTPDLKKTHSIGDASKIVPISDYPYTRPDGGIECYVFEQVPKKDWLPDYYLSKLIYWVDRHYFAPLRLEQYGKDGNLALIWENVFYPQYPERGRKGVATRFFVFWDTRIDHMTSSAYEFWAETDFSDIGGWENFINPDHLTRMSLWLPATCLLAFDGPKDFFLRPSLYPDRFPKDRPINIDEETLKRIKKSEETGNLID